MLKEAQKGLAFSTSAIMKVYHDIDMLSQVNGKFEALLRFLRILDTLARSVEQEHWLIIVCKGAD